MSKSKKIIILLSGQIATGKSTICDGLRKEYGFEIVSTFEILQKRARIKHNGNIPKDRDFYQKFGRKQDKDTNGRWVLDETQHVISKHDRVLIDSVRKQEQIDSFRSSYGQSVVHIHLDAPLEWRRDHFITRRREFDFSNDEEAAAKFKQYENDETEKEVAKFTQNSDLVIHTQDSSGNQDQVVRAASFLRLLPPIRHQNVDVIIGGQFGSEGKGQIAAFMAPEYDCLVRVGGPNAGHKVYNEPNPDVFHIIPSGTGKAQMAKLIIGPGAVISEEVILKEISDWGLDSQRLIIDENATIIRAKDKKWEEKQDNIGSTKQGVGAATAANILDRVKGSNKHKASNSKLLTKFIGKAHYEFEKLNRNGKKILIEGTQGTMLSLHHGLYPHVTSRDTTVSGCLAECGIGPGRVRKIVMVVRRYPIRVQSPNGGTSGDFLSTELDLQTISKRSKYPLEELKKIEKTTTTKKDRRIAEFSWHLFRKACELNTPTDISLTFSDYITYDNQKARRYDQLSQRTTKFIDEMERCAGVPVSMIATRFSYRSVIDRRHWI